jgi:hypothetical protein
MLRIGKQIAMHSLSVVLGREAAGRDAEGTVSRALEIVAWSLENFARPRACNAMRWFGGYQSSAAGQRGGHEQHSDIRIRDYSGNAVHEAGHCLSHV